MNNLISVEKKKSLTDMKVQKLKNTLLGTKHSCRLEMMPFRR